MNGSLKIATFEPEATEAEPVQRLKDAIDVVIGGAKPDVEIAGETRMAMRCQRISADDQVLNSVRVE